MSGMVTYHPVSYQVYILIKGGTIPCLIYLYHSRNNRTWKDIKNLHPTVLSARITDQN
ncbi:hypothetical protein BS47DRAFT_695928 [Hydnum rufescens UP504]|uniref:Uncharacterized protein n=1 Tax=Hydnum rufescens UP504 TaxID=1448309 RepID=A0A9P6DN48_9AGAM|nr:hypothetical protein BS47DRAFT_695928 [Hydnum rufescens UP504]